MAIWPLRRRGGLIVMVIGTAMASVITAGTGGLASSATPTLSSRGATVLGGGRATAHDALNTTNYAGCCYVDISWTGAISVVPGGTIRGQFEAHGLTHTYSGGSMSGPQTSCVFYSTTEDSRSGSVPLANLEYVNLTGPCTIRGKQVTLTVTMLGRITHETAGLDPHQHDWWSIGEVTVTMPLRALPDCVGVPGVHACWA